MKALVTGANKGIGFEIARNLGAQGYAILVGARDEARGQTAVKKLATEGLLATFIKIDLNDLDSLHIAGNTIDSLDLLVNNAGIPDRAKRERPALDLTKHTFDYMLWPTLFVIGLTKHVVNGAFSVCRMVGTRSSAILSIRVWRRPCVLAVRPTRISAPRVASFPLFRPGRLGIS